MLETLANEAQGDFRLAKLNVDESPNLSIRYGVRSIPVIKAFRDGEMISELIGLQPEPRLRQFIQSIAPSQSDLMVEKAFSLLEMDEPEEAEDAFLDALDETPDNTKAQLGLAMSLLRQGRGVESNVLLENFPASREYNSAEILRPLAKALAEMERKQPKNNENPLDAAYANSLRLVKLNNYEAAMDGLLDILREDKHYRKDQARIIMVALLELLGESNPIARQYRSELASVLF
jgi:putative thioredoxin